MSINSVSKAISSKIAKEISLSTEKQAVIEYGLINLLSQMLTIFLLLIVAFAFGIVNEVIIIGLCSAILRRYSGGAHCSSPMRCSLLSVINVPILVFLAKFIYNLQPTVYITFILLISLISIIIYVIYAPQDTPAKPIKNIKRIKDLKVKSVFMAVLIFFVSTGLIYLNLGSTSVLMALGSFNQALTLTNPGKAYIVFSDRILKTIMH